MKNKTLVGLSRIGLFSCESSFYFFFYPLRSRPLPTPARFGTRPSCVLCVCLTYEHELSEGEFTRAKSAHELGFDGVIDGCTGACAQRGLHAEKARPRQGAAAPPTLLSPRLGRRQRRQCPIIRRDAWRRRPLALRAKPRVSPFASSRARLTRLSNRRDRSHRRGHGGSPTSFGDD